MLLFDFQAASARTNLSSGKRNTTRPVFTSHERSLAKANWASKSARLHRDSFLPFGSCSLCLELARDPVSCLGGDIFCRECALANMLAQKQDIKRADKARRQAERDTARAQAAHDDEDQRRAVRDFELTQAGLSGSARPAAERDAAKSSLLSFWTPSLTPDATKDARLLEASKKTKPVAVCPASASDNPHALSMQHLITIHFDEHSDPSKRAGTRTCPSCRKTLTNASSPAMAIKCGHVLCLGCVKQFVAPPPKQAAKETTRDAAAACFVCDTPLSWRVDAFTSTSTSTSTSKPSLLPSGMIALKSEGTGFSARGGNTVERNNVAFQC
ncbi:zinc finger containing [Cordyceps militaris]|uniref:Zinc finger containing n=1 Tax=Cordyceps militaris TaxID=73501 RepID=A0A2H4S8Q7_CORMI|nr:zinc finger containing [Cordyceps militaris]